MFYVALLLLLLLAFAVAVICTRDAYREEREQKNKQYIVVEPDYRWRR